MVDTPSYRDLRRAREELLRLLQGRPLLRLLAGLLHESPRAFDYRRKQVSMSEGVGHRPRYCECQRLVEVGSSGIVVSGLGAQYALVIQGRGKSRFSCWLCLRQFAPRLLSILGGRLCLCQLVLFAKGCRVPELISPPYPTQRPVPRVLVP